MRHYRTFLIFGLPLLLLFSLVSCKDTGVDTEAVTVDFWAQRMDTSDWYQVTGVLTYEGDYSIIFVEEDYTGDVTPEDAREISEEFDGSIYPLITSKFGEASDQDNDGKITILILDILDGGSETSYVAGYFDATHELSSESNSYSNERDMLFMDCDPGVPGSSQFNMTMAHEMQHLVNFNREYLSDEDGNGSADGDLMDTWINEGLSSAAEYLYNGSQISIKVDMYNNEAYGVRSEIQGGTNFLKWNNELANYSTVYLFFQWLRIHADNGDGIYKDILNHVEPDYTAVEDVANDNPLFSGHDWHSLLRDWFIANQLNQDTGIYGYGNDPVLDLNPPYHGGNDEVTLSPGEAVYVDLETPGIIDLTPGTDIDYAGIKFDPDVIDTEPDGGGYDAEVLLSYNHNGNPGENGELTETLPLGSVLPGGQSNSSRGFSSVQLPGQPIPIGVIFNPDGTSSQGVE